ncbi:dienelactone hydrolase family protein [Spirulina subsalsa]|uniref:dienelactone hydrolase family protein n=1 Tax=Spirulina subsalsa TaxID=54311 RepID=UPI00030A7864|nr:dienelactone hydrolase family protein [Spirulina subsalsa]
MLKKYFGLALAVCLFLSTWGIAQSQATLSPSLGEQMAQLHQGDRPIPTPLVAQAPRMPIQSEMVTYGTVEEKPLMGYLAAPTDYSEDLPAIIVIHEWWGLNDNIKMMSDRLAGEGYRVLAVDLYGGETADNPEAALQLVTNANNNPEQLLDNLALAYHYLKTEHNAPKVASLGWCFGGRWSLNTGLLLPDQLDAVVIYYGGGMETDPERLKTLEMPILGIFGELDQNPSVETVREFEATLQALGKTAEIHIYKGADHAFANPSGTRYNAKAAADAWEKTIDFLNRFLKGQESSTSNSEA